MGYASFFGVKLAHSEFPIVAVVGYGAFLFSSPQPLWSYARYQAAVTVTVIVMNNRSYNYNNEHKRIRAMSDRQFEAGRDMACYLGDPDVDFAKMASACGVESVVVEEPLQFVLRWSRPNTPHPRV